MSSACCGVVLTAQEPDLARLLLADRSREQPGAEAAVERPDARTGLTEARVVGRDREVAHHVQHVAAADRVPRDHRDHRLREPADLDLEVEHVEAADAVVADVAVVAADALVATGAERVGPLAGEDDHADVAVVAGLLERVLSSKRVRGRNALRTSGRLIVILATRAAPVSGPATAVS